MANDTLQQLAKIVSSDEYDIAAGDRIKKLQGQWDLLEAKEGLENHLIVTGFMDELKDWAKRIDDNLLNMDVTDDKTILFRLKLKADKEVIQMFLSIFDKNNRKSLENSIRFIATKIKPK